MVQKIERGWEREKGGCEESDARIGMMQIEIKGKTEVKER